MISDELRSRIAKHIGQVLFNTAVDAVCESRVEDPGTRKPVLPLHISEMEEGSVAESGVGSLVKQWWLVSGKGDVKPAGFDVPLSPYLYFVDDDGILIQEWHEGENVLRRACSLATFFGVTTLTDMPVVWKSTNLHH